MGSSLPVYFSLFGIALSYGSKRRAVGANSGKRRYRCRGSIQKIRMFSSKGSDVSNERF